MTTARRPWYTVLYVQVLLAIAVGIIIGHFFPNAGVALKPLGDGFISLDQDDDRAGHLLHGRARHRLDARPQEGRPRRRQDAVLFPRPVSTLALVIGLVVGKLLQPGKGFDIVISRWEGELDVGRLNKVMAHPVALGEEFEDQPA